MLTRRLDESALGSSNLTVFPFCAPFVYVISFIMAGSLVICNQDILLYVSFLDVIFLFELEYWDSPRRCSAASGVHASGLSVTHGPTTLSGSSHAPGDPLSTVFSGRSVVSVSPSSNSSYVGSMLSISTLTSSNTLIGGGGTGSSFNALQEGVSPVTETDVSSISMSTGIPTAGAAAAAASAALLGASSASPKQRVTFVFTSREDKADWMAALVYLQLSR